MIVGFLELGAILKTSPQIVLSVWIATIGALKACKFSLALEPVDVVLPIADSQNHEGDLILELFSPFKLRIRHDQPHGLQVS